MTSPSPLEELIAAYIIKRDELAELKKQHREEEALHKQKLEMVEEKFLKFLDAKQAESIKTKAGTVFKKTVVSAMVQDWEATLDHIKQHEDWGMLDRRVSKTAVQEYMEKTGEGVPGVKVSSFTSVNIRRS